MVAAFKLESLAGIVGIRINAEMNRSLSKRAIAQLITLGHGSIL